MNSVETPTFRVTLGEDGILRFVVLSGETVTAEHARLHVDAIVRVSGGRLLPMLTDVRLANSIDHAARVVLQENSVVSANAILVASPISRVMANVFTSFSKAKYPSKVFTSPEEAIAWLQRFLTSEQSSD
jgi:hypothetical protein